MSLITSPRSGPAADVRMAERRAARANRACIACRARKQRCIPPLNTNQLQAPCQRCMRHGMTCSFETDKPPSVAEELGPSQLAHIVVELQRKINLHEQRLAELELEAQQSRKDVYQNAEATPVLGYDRRLPISPTGASEVTSKSSQARDHSLGTATSKPATFTMDNLDLASPIATLRSLGALEGDVEGTFSPYDPVACGVIAIQEAQELFNIYFDHCHPWAPILNENLRSICMSLRKSSPVLFLCIVSIGARFWHGNSLHPKYFDIVALLDKAISQLAMFPSSSDANLNSVRALMLYLQWMPCSLKEGSQDDQTSGSSIKTRYNDLSAWTVFGIAIRYAAFLNLERQALAPFRSTGTALSQEDFDTMRVWLNLVSYDCSLTHTSGLPLSIDPHPAARVVRQFCSDRLAQEPGDTRYAALIELACIVHRAKSSIGEYPQRHPNIASLKKANVDMEEWERCWLSKLRQTRLQYLQLPFTSLRWYRLTLNSSLLRPLLSSSTRVQTDIYQVSTLSFLETSLTAASQIILSLANGADQFIWHLNSQSVDSFPKESFGIDPVARTSLHHAVDATWISFTFAITYIVLCYVRDTIDDDLRISNLPNTNSPARRVPLKPRPDSILARLTRIAVDIFEAETSGPEFRPEGGYEAVVRDAASLVLDQNPEQPVQIAQGSLDPAIQSLFDLMDDTVYDWPNNFRMEDGTEFNQFWGPRY
ncbi:hypothetical protein BX600DRAFT_447839 [Xylariales sp. PMI_506]|nr:hypothetical protein BX600DRAFT_447839 [Xylariales sp. PMI_506]